MSAVPTTYLTTDQVFSLNQKHGWFEFGDAQGDVSKAFAQDAIATHERIRGVAPELLDDLVTAAATFRRYEVLHRAKNTVESNAKADVNKTLADRFEKTIAKATGAAA